MSKIYAVLFANRTILNLSQPRVIVNGSDVKYAELFKFLSCVIDNKLRWNFHAEHVAKLNVLLEAKHAMMRATRRFFPISVKLTKYYTLVYSYLSYCISVGE